MTIWRLRLFTMIEITRVKGGFRLQTSHFLPCRREDIFPFFADARNLERITPPSLRFEILTPPPIEMQVGCIIDYRLHIHRIPVRWQTEISAWEPPYRFPDQARRSPYRHWIHEHTFEEQDGGTLCVDEVHYGVPGGSLINTLFVKRDLVRIFEYRRRVMQEILAPSSVDEKPFGAEAAQAITA